MAHPSAELYGTDRVFLESVDAFLERGWHVEVTVPVRGPLLDELEHRHVPVHLCGSPVLRKSLMSPAGVVRLLRDSAVGAPQGLRLIRAVRADVVYVNTLTIPLWPLLGRLSGRRVLTHVHEAEGSASGPIKTALALPLLAATTVVANSRYSADIHAAAVPALRGKIHVVYNAVPVVPARPAPARSERPLRILYVGRLSHRKGVDVVVDALAQLRDRGIAATLEVAGSVYPGYEPYEAGLRQRVEELGLDGAVRFHGFVADVSGLREESDVAVVPSRLDEPFGNTAVETLLAARPLVVSDTSGLREAAEGYASALFVPPGEPSALADALADVRERWDDLRLLAADDAAAAARKHGPQKYRSEIAAWLERTARTSGTPETADSLQ